MGLKRQVAESLRLLWQQCAEPRQGSRAMTLSFALDLQSYVMAFMTGSMPPCGPMIASRPLNARSGV
jgi:hypothetical protein